MNEPKISKFEPETVGKSKNFDRLNSKKTICSSELLGHSNEVLIMHNESQYLLRCTRNGKLILTK
jgi:hemin uptake protein HemP